MRKLHRGLAVAVLILASQAGDGACSGTSGLPKACAIDTRGIEVHDRAITNVITIKCDLPPRDHALEAWLEHRGSSGEPWIQGSETGWEFAIPDAEGYSVTLRAYNCIEGSWRTQWHVYGIGPSGVSFDVADHDTFSTTIDPEDCR